MRNNDVLFYGVRHGTTNGNDQNIYRSWSNDPKYAHLNDQGKDEARLAGMWFLNNRIHPDILIADNLDRVTQTAQIVADILGIKEIHSTPKLHPLNMGDYTLKSKAEYPVEPFLKDPSKKIPGGESVNGFNKRQTDFFDEMINAIAQSGKLVCFFWHGSNVSYLHNHLFNRTGKERVGYEGLVNPGGIIMAADDGLYPLTQVRGNNRQKYKDGTALAGFVTDEENRPPRECWNCRNFNRDVIGGYCNHSIVKIDPELQERKRDDGNITVDDRDCCDNFRNKIAVSA